MVYYKIKSKGKIYKGVFETIYHLLEKYNIKMFDYKVIDMWEV